MATTDKNNVKVFNRGIRAFGQVQASLLGYISDKGVGGAVTQATSKATAVTLDKATGTITTDDASLAGDATVSFTVNNSEVEAGDAVHVAVKSGASTGLYTAHVTAVADGSFEISVTNVGSTAGEVIEINFAIIRASNN